jgi:hypothetical protein
MPCGIHWRRIRWRTAGPLAPAMKARSPHGPALRAGRAPAGSGSRPRRDRYPCVRYDLSPTSQATHGTRVPLERECWFARLKGSKLPGQFYPQPAFFRHKPDLLDEPTDHFRASVRVSSALRASRSPAIFSRYTASWCAVGRRSFQLIDEIAAQGFEGLHLRDNGGASMTGPGTFAKYSRIVTRFDRAQIQRVERLVQLLSDRDQLAELAAALHLSSDPRSFYSTARRLYWLLFAPRPRNMATPLTLQPAKAAGRCAVVSVHRSLNP